MVLVEFFGGLAYYVKDRRLEIKLERPARLREVLDMVVQSLDRPARSMLMSGGSLRAIVILNGAAESDFDKLVSNEDRIVLTSPIEGGCGGRDN